MNICCNVLRVSIEGNFQNDQRTKGMQKVKQTLRKKQGRFESW